MSFIQNDKRIEIDALFESYCDTNLSNWLDADQIFEVAFEVYTNRRRRDERNKRKQKQQRKRQ